MGEFEPALGLGEILGTERLANVQRQQARQAIDVDRSGADKVDRRDRAVNRAVIGPSARSTQQDEENEDHDAGRTRDPPGRGAPFSRLHFPKRSWFNAGIMVARGPSHILTHILPPRLQLHLDSAHSILGAL